MPGDAPGDAPGDVPGDVPSEVPDDAGALRGLRVSLTGAGGALGTVLRPLLLEAGADLCSTALVDLDPLGPGEEIVAGDLRDPAVVDRVLHGREMVLHLAGTSTERPLDEIIDNNLRALHTLYEGARRHRVRRIVAASSNHAFGLHEAGEPLALDAPYRPDGLYGLSKVWGEAMARLYWDKHGIEGVSLRIGSAVPRPTEVRHLSTWLGHEDLWRLVRAALTAPAPGCIAVWGVSDNARSWWSNAGAERLGYRPRQNAEDWAAEILASPDRRDPVSRAHQGGSYANEDWTPAGLRPIR